MARIRTIKPELPRDKRLASLPREARYHFLLLLTVADDEGFFRADPRTLIGNIYPHDPDVMEAEVDSMTEGLRSVGILELFDTDDGVIAHVRNWKKHQRIDKPTKSFLATLSRTAREGVEPASDLQERWVYALRRPSDGAIKIGISGDPLRRWVEIAYSVRESLEFLGCVRGGFAMESDAHNRFKRFALGGEWFQGVGEIEGWARATLLDTSPRPYLARISRDTREPLATSSPESWSLELGVLRSGAERPTATSPQPPTLPQTADRPESSNGTAPLPENQPEPTAPLDLPKLPKPVVDFLAMFYEPAFTETARTRYRDVARQLADTVDPKHPGPKIRGGVRSKARNPEHLSDVCRAVMSDPPRDRDVAVVFVLKRLLDPPKGPTESELHAAREAEARSHEDHEAADRRRTALAWANDPTNRAAYDLIVTEVDGHFATAPKGNAFAVSAREAMLTAKCAAAASTNSTKAVDSNAPVVATPWRQQPVGSGG